MLDINADMLAVGRERTAGAVRATASTSWRATPRSCLSPTRAFDAYTIAFGIRNVPRIDRALSEAHRVLKRGGRFLCLEFSHVDVPGLDTIYDAYSFAAVPALGRVVTRGWAALSLPRRIDPQVSASGVFSQMMRDAGFRRVTERPMSGGIVRLAFGLAPVGADTAPCPKSAAPAQRGKRTINGSGGKPNWKFAFRRFGGSGP